jgi:4-hydroxy-3-methylbut-2-enyl diphosphate reductase
MKIRLAKSSGYCMGVRRAMEQALDAVHHNTGPIYSYGPLIHNPQALELLAQKGLKALSGEPADLERVSSGTVIIRAHGVPPEVKADLKKRGLDVIDATCPRVIRVQMIIRKHARQGYATLIWGNRDHPEVIGLLGYAEGRGQVIGGPEDVGGLPDLGPVILVAQTTQNQARFAETARAVQARWPEALVFDTICGATSRRQDDVRELSRDVDAMVVVGGHDSGNTKRLAAVAREAGIRAVHIETEAELDPAWLAGARVIGVTAGASTPNWMIKRVLRHLERLARKRDVSLRTWALRVLRAMVLSNVYVAFGAGVLCMTGALLQGIEPSWLHFGVAAFYVHAMHLLNLFLDKETSQFNDPDRALFVERHRRVLLGSGLFSAAVALGLSLVLGARVFLVLAVMSTLGLLYAVPVAPRSFQKYTRLRRLKDIPSSKTLSLSGGWALTLGLIPAAAPGGRISWATLGAGAFIFLLVFIRSALGDVLEIQGDRIVGRETIPILIGENKTLQLLGILTQLMVVLLAAGWALGLFSTLALGLLATAGYAMLYLALFRREPVIGSVFFDALIDGNFILAGLAALVWSLSGS